MRQKRALGLGNLILLLKKTHIIKNCKEYSLISNMPLVWVHGNSFVIPLKLRGWFMNCLAYFANMPLAGVYYYLFWSYPIYCCVV